MSDSTIFAIVVLLVLLVILFYFIFREKPENLEPLPAHWKDLLMQNVRFYRSLDSKEKTRFEENIRRFLNHVNIVPVETDAEDLDKLYVASSAVIAVFGYPKWQFRNIDEVILYEDSFDLDYNTKGRGRNILGIVGDGKLKGAMILSKKALRAGFENEQSTHNVGIHEFTHLIDKSDGAVDGVPKSFLQHYAKPWLEIVHQEILKIQLGSSDINLYGATSEAEFLSVITEYFFNQPTKFKRMHPELYDKLSMIFMQDLAGKY